jgi:hypothetical protein
MASPERTSPMMQETCDPDTDIGPPSLLLDPMIMFYHDLIRDERDFPAMRDPERIPVFEFFSKDHEGDRPPDIETARTKAYIVGWELRKDHYHAGFRPSEDSE